MLFRDPYGHIVYIEAIANGLARVTFLEDMSTRYMRMDRLTAV